jgi:universal stress protein A
MFTRILVPTDFSDASDSALDYGKALATHFGASLYLIHVVEDPIAATAFGVEGYIAEAPGFGAALRADAERRLAVRLTPAERSRLRASAELLSGRCAPTIVNAAVDRDIDLIVMGTHGRTGVAHALMGSVAERVVRTAPCPVLTVHAMSARVRNSESNWSRATAPS